MAGNIIYCFDVPSLSFSCDFEVFPARPPWFCDQDLSFFRLRLSFRVSTETDYPDDYMPCALSIFLRIPLIGFAPLKHVDIEELLGLVMPDLSRTVAGFGYPLSVHRSSTSQALFHACSAHGVSFTERFAETEA